MFLYFYYFHVNISLILWFTLHRGHSCVYLTPFYIVVSCAGMVQLCMVDHKAHWQQYQFNPILLLNSNLNLHLKSTLAGLFWSFTSTIVFSIEMTGVLICFSIFGIIFGFVLRSHDLHFFKTISGAWGTHYFKNTMCVLHCIWIMGMKLSVPQCTVLAFASFINTVSHTFVWESDEDFFLVFCYKRHMWSKSKF